MGSAIGSVAGAVGLGTKKGRGVLFGKKKTIGADPLARDIRRVAGKALFAQEDVLKDIKKVDAGSMARQAIGREKAALRGAAADQRRGIQENIARRGLGRSSLALTAGSGIQRALGDRIARTEGTFGQRRFRNIGQRAGIINKIAAANKFPIQMRDRKTKSGGIAGLLGAGVGAAFGGPQGAAAGMQVGQGLSGQFAA
jgi:hypothetical protein